MGFDLFTPTVHPSGDVIPSAKIEHVVSPGNIYSNVDNAKSSHQGRITYNFIMYSANYHLSTSSVLPLSTGVLSASETGMGSAAFSATISGSFSISTEDDATGCC